MNDEAEKEEEERQKIIHAKTTANPNSSVVWRN